MTRTARPILAALAALALAVTAIAATGCAEPRSLLVSRPTDHGADLAVTALWAHEIHQVARDGDWILTRSYVAIADVIVLGTRGEDLSHASIYDASRDTVIEAVGSGVREIPLAALLERNHYAIVVRPGRMTAAAQAAALARARAQVGTPFDYAGMIGFDDPDKFYCSELVYWVSDTAARHGLTKTVTTPAGLMAYGEVLYWSGERTDAQVMKIATARRARPTTRARTAAR